MGPRQIDHDGAAALLACAQRLFVPGCTGEPLTLHKIVSKEPARFSHLSILTSYVAGLNRLDCPLMENAAETIGFFPPPPGFVGRHRQMVTSYFGICKAVAEISPDIVFIPVTRPDRNGLVAPGASAEFVEDILGVARARVAIVSPAMPALRAGYTVPLDCFSHMMLDDMGPLVVNVGRHQSDPAIAAIVGQLRNLIPDGATLQTGIGKVPAALFQALAGHKNLRIHSGLVSQNVRLLVEAGALNTDVPICCATVAGDAGFYAWLDSRKDFALRPVNHTHNPATLAAIPKLITINSAIEVDLLGQVNAEHVGGRAISAAGGLSDFTAAGHRSARGFSVIALPATDASGRNSRIVRYVSPCTPISVPRSDVDIVVTEYGVADLRGRTAEERAKALVAVAAPRFRKSLTEAIDVLPCGACGASIGEWQSKGAPRDDIFLDL